MASPDEIDLSTVTGLATPPAPLAVDSQDPAVADEWMRLVASRPTVGSQESLQYKLAYPEFSLDHISQNLPEFRQRAQVEGVPWAQVWKDHPTLQKYLRDPDKMGQALNETALLTGMQRFMGGFVPTINDDGTKGRPHYAYDPATTKLFQEFLPKLGWGMDRLLAMPFEIADWASHALLDPISQAVTGEKASKDSIWRESAKYWRDRAAIYEPFVDHTDYVGNAFRESNTLTRTAYQIYDTTLQMTPLMVGGGFAGAAYGSGGLLAFNTLYATPETYEKFYAATGSPGEAAVATALTAPVIGKFMGWSPLGSAQGQVLAHQMEMAGAKLAQQLTPGFWAMTRFWAGRAGVDVVAGQFGLAMQGAAEAYVDQTARALGGEETDSSAVVKAFYNGLKDPSMLGLHAVGIAREIGRFQRARADVTRINKLMDKFEAMASEENGSLVDEAAHDIGKDPDAATHVFVDMERFHEAAAAAKLDPMEAARKIWGDEGATYAYALSTHEQDLAIPVGRLRYLKALQLQDLPRKFGRLDPMLAGDKDLQEISGKFAKAYVKAMAEDLGQGAGEVDAGLLKAIKAFAGTKGQVKPIYATIMGLRETHPELSPQQIYNAIWGPGGLYGPRAQDVQTRQGESVAWGSEKLYEMSFIHPGAPEMELLAHETTNEQGQRALRIDLQHLPGAKGKSVEEIKKLKEEVGGQGYSTALYMRALQEAQRRKIGFQSDEAISTTDATKRMYARLQEMGVNFRQDMQGRFVISAEDLAKADLSGIDESRRVRMGGLEEPLIRQVETNFTDPRWFKPFQEEQQRISMEEQARAAMEASRGKLKDALAKGLRKFLPEERVKAEDRARQDVTKDPVYRALHWFQKGEIWQDYDGSAKARLEIPDVNLGPAERNLKAAQDRLVSLRDPKLGEVAREARKLPRLAQDADALRAKVNELQAGTDKALEDRALAEQIASNFPPASMENEGLTKKDQAFLFKKQYDHEKMAERLSKAQAALSAKLGEVDALQRIMNAHPDHALYEQRIADAEGQVKIAEKALDDAKAYKSKAGQPRKLLASQIDELMGPGAAEGLKGKGVVTDDPRYAIDVDAAANALGFEGSAATGDPARRLLSGLRDALTEGQYVKQLADLRLKERYGADLFERPEALMQAALDAAHNEKTVSMIQRTYRALAKSLDPLTQARSAMTREQWEITATKIVQNKLIKDLKPDRIAAAGRRATEKALEAIDEGRNAAAANHLEAALLHHYVYQAVRDLQAELGPKWSELGRMAESPRGRMALGLADPLRQDGTQPTYLPAFDAAMRSIGVLPQPEGYTPDASIVSKLIARVTDNGHDQYLSTLLWDPQVVQGVISQSKHWSKLAPDEAFQIHAFATNLQHLAKRVTAESEALGNKQIEELRDGITTYLRVQPAGQPGVTGLEAPNPRMLDTGLKARERGVLGNLYDRTVGWGLHALGWDADSTMAPWNRLSELGPVGELIEKKFADARNLRDELMKEFFYPWQEIRKKFDLDPKLYEEAKGAAEMLGLRTRADDNRVTRAWLMNLARWWGDMDGRAKIGEAWALTPENVEKTLATYLTKDMLDAIQAEKELIDTKMRPKLAAVHMQRTGTPLTEVQPIKFKVKWADGTESEYAGGYYPIHWDQSPGNKPPPAALVNQARRPIVPGGFLVERTGGHYEPDLNWASMSNHMLQVAHNLAFGDFVQDASRVLLHPDVQKEIAAYRGDKAAVGLQRWLERVALDVSGGPDATVARQDKDVGLRMLRRSLVRSTVAFNYPILFAHATHPLATGEARYGPQYALDYGAPAMSDVFGGYAEAMATGRNSVREEALATFSELQHRSDVLREEMGRWLLDKELAIRPTNKLQRFVNAVDEHVVEGAGMAHLRFMDEAFSTVTALAKYREVFEKTRDHNAAVDAANKEVRETMPSYSQMEQPEVLADKHSLRSVGVIWHTYYSKWREIWRDSRYENVTRPAEEAGGNEPAALRAWHESKTFGTMMTGLGMALILGAYFKGDGPEKHEKAAHWWMKHAVLAPTETLPYARSMTEAAWRNLIEGKKPQPYDFANSYLSPIAHLVDATTQLGDPYKTKEDRAMKLARAGAEFIGFPKPVLNLGQFALHAGQWWDRSPDGAAATAVDFTAHVFYPYKWGRNRMYQTSNPLMDAAKRLEE